MNNTNIDFQTFHLFKAIFNTTSVSKAASELGISQPAASRGLGKLREHFADELFVNVGRGMVPTPLAEELYPNIAQLVELAATVLNPTYVDIAQSSQIFTIISTDYGVHTVLYPLYKTLIKDAPNLRLEIRPMNTANIQVLQQGGIDFMLYSDDEISQEFYKVDLFKETHICLVDKNNPLAKCEQISLRQFRQADHAMVNIQGSRHQMNDDIFWNTSLKNRDIKLWIPYFHLAPQFIENTNLVLTLPKKLKPLVNTTRLVEIKLPRASPTFTYRLVWHKRTHKSAAHVWFRQYLKQSISQRI